MDLIQKIIHAITQVHPPHIMFVHFPIALTGAALFFILLALWKKNEIFEKVAFANISLAAVSTVVAALVGIQGQYPFLQRPGAQSCYQDCPGEHVICHHRCHSHSPLEESKLVPYPDLQGLL